MLSSHPRPVAEQRPAGEGTRRVDGEDRDIASAGARHSRQSIAQRALADSRRAGDPDDSRAPPLGKEHREELAGVRVTILDQRQCARKGAPVAAPKPLGQWVQVQGLEHIGGGYSESNCLAITIRWISDVPSPIVMSLESRK